MKKNKNKNIKKIQNEGNILFNKFMDQNDKEINKLEYSISKLEKEMYEENERTYYESFVPKGEKNYGWEEIKLFYDNNDWFHECDVCLENTRNNDCKCVDIICKCDMTYMETHIVYNHFIEQEKPIIMPKVIKNVPILSLF